MNFENQQIILVLVLSVSAVALLSIVVGSRGGRYRGLPGWSGFWGLLALFLALTGRVSAWVTFPILVAVMFISLREYLFLAPVRPQDRWGILFAYLSIPAIIYPILSDSYPFFISILLLFLFLLLPAALSFGPAQAGLLDSLGRVLLGLLIYVFCAAHLGWMMHLSPGRVELFAILAISAEFPQRLAGRLAFQEQRLRPLAGVAIGAILAAAMGAWLGPWVDVASREGWIVGLLVAAAITGGGLVSRAVSADLELGAATSRLGRAALLDRITPAVYAAPVFYHFIDHFA
jgi:phosphatidate cytidylyltransferase